MRAQLFRPGLIHPRRACPGLLRREPSRLADAHDEQAATGRAEAVQRWSQRGPIFPPCTTSNSLNSNLSYACFLIHSSIPILSAEMSCYKVGIPHHRSLNCAWLPHTMDVKSYKALNLLWSLAIVAPMAAAAFRNIGPGCCPVTIIIASSHRIRPPPTAATAWHQTRKALLSSVVSEGCLLSQLAAVFVLYLIHHPTVDVQLKCIISPTRV